MSWINENKFAAALAGVTAVISGGILFFGVSQGGVYEDKLMEYNDRKDDLVKTSETKPYPNERGLALRKEGLVKYESLIKKVNVELQSYKPDELKALTPEEFSDARVTMERELRDLFTKNEVELPADCSFGFERYSAVQASAEATAKLNFQLSATNSLLVKLAGSKPHQLTNIKRYELPIENGVKLDEMPRNRNKKDGKKAYQRLPMELAFTGSESSVRDFLKAMVSAKDYFYSVNLLRIKNQKQISPKQQDVDFPKAVDASGAGNVDFADFMDEGDKGGATELAPTIASEPGSRVLNQILGAELLHVHLSFDILLVRDASGRQ